MRLLVLTRYDTNGASSRYRFYQYFPFLKDAGFNLDVFPFFDEKYLQNLYSHNKRSKLYFIRSILRRISILFSVRKYDLVWIEYELIPYFPAVFERLLAWFGVKYIVEYDDAIFHRYDLHNKSIIRRLFGKKIARVMENAALVITGNRYLADYAKKSGAKCVEVVPTVIDLEKFPAFSPAENTLGPFVIGWLGSPSTAKYLEVLQSPFAHVCENNQVLINLIGANKVNLNDIPVHYIAWSEADEIQQLKKFNVGVMPLPDTPWERGKCGFKLIQYMACGLPVVASPVGVNCDIVEEGQNGFLAKASNDWINAFNQLIGNPELQREMGEKGRKLVEQKYCVQVTSKKLIEYFQSVV